MATSGNSSAEAQKPRSEYRADFARYLVHQDVLREIAQIDWSKLSEEFVKPTGRIAGGLPEMSKTFADKLKNGKDAPIKDLKVGIVGAGIAGLYTALMCQLAEIPWEIFEADPTRVGGRLYTYWFDPAREKQGLHDYYDIGAMRFPDTPIMERTFHLFKYTHTEKHKYYMKDRHGVQPLRYNDITYIPVVPHSKPPSDHFKVSRKNNGPVPNETVENPDQILDDAYRRFREKIKRAIDAPKPLDSKSNDDYESKKDAAAARAWEFLLKHDRFSLRDYLTFVEGETFETTHWLETLNAGTGWFDQAFTENVLESLAFDYYDDEEKKNQKNGSGQVDVPRLHAPDAVAERGEWYYLQNGSSSLVINLIRILEEKISGSATSKKYPEATLDDFPGVKERIHLGRRVTRMGEILVEVVPGKPVSVGMELEHVDSTDKSRIPQAEVFSAIFNSTTFGALQRMDLTGLNLPYDTKAAIRSLRYDPSTKVAIRFHKQWWTDTEKLPVELKPIEGGLGKTDMPLRTCVYPSYNIGEKEGSVLLCSYTWGADSERIASMINETKMRDRKDLKKTDQLAQVMLDNLARLHTTTEADYKKLLEYISRDDVFDTYHAHDWSKDTYTCGGAFALFSPSQFSRVYPTVTRPLCSGRFHIIGEAASAHHAWVVGALDSAARAMHLMLGHFGLFQTRKKLEEELLPIGEVDEQTEYLQYALSKLPPSDRPCGMLN